MPNGRPGDSRHHDIVHHGLDVFGPSCDALVREITARLPRHRLDEFQDLVETWPFEPDGRAHDTDALFARLVAFRESLAEPAPPARGSVPSAGRARPIAPPAPRRGGAGRALLAGLAGFVMGGLGAGLAAGILGLVLMPTSGSGDEIAAYAMGLGFGLIPLAALAGGAVLAVLLVRRALRR